MQSASIDKPTTASPPFDDPKADLIIRSSDNIHFCVHKKLLSIVSPVFEGMFTLPDDTSQELYDGRPCVPVSDHSRHLFCLLSWCDPRCKRPPATLENIIMTLEIADKYAMDSIFAHAKKDLLGYNPSVGAVNEPLMVFAIAIRFRLDEIAQKAARDTLRLPIAFFRVGTTLKHISVSALQNLYNYHHSCKMAVQDILARPLWVQVMNSIAEIMSHSTQPTKLVEKQPHTHDHGVEYFLLRRVLVTDNNALWFSTEQTAPWWSQFMNTMMYRLLDQPGAFSDPHNSKFFEEIQRSISLDKCRHCRNHGYARLNRVSKHLSSLIDTIVSTVRNAD